MGLGSKSKTGKFALGFFIVASLFVFLSFVSPYWLVSDGTLKNATFIRLGLWEVCFDKYKDHRHLYDAVFNGCWWIFEEEFYIIREILLPGFFVATQFFFTVTLCCILVGIFFAVLYIKKDEDEDIYLTLLVTLGTVLVLGGLSGIISVVIFGARGDGRDWMSDWDHNDLGWAYALGVIGVNLLFPAGILFLIQARVHKYKRLHSLQSRDPSSYTMQERKVSYVGGHTDI